MAASTQVANPHDRLTTKAQNREVTKRVPLLTGRIWPYILPYDL